MHYFYLVVILCAFSVSANFAESIAQKVKQKSLVQLIDLNDKEVNYLLYNSNEEWLILFYDSDIKTTNILLNAWKAIALNLYQEDHLVNVAKVDLRKNNTNSFIKLKLYRYPCAIYLVKNNYYNYTGVLDYDSMVDLVKNQNYFNYDKLSVPEPLGYLDLAIHLGRSINTDSFEVKIILGVLAILIIGYLGVIYHCVFIRDKYEIKEE